VVKDEEIRKLQVSQCLLQGEASELHEQLEEEQARSGELEKALEDALAQLDEQKSVGVTAQNQIRMQTREVANLKVGIRTSSQNCSANPNRPR
jgi:predicted RNase H-like nuclease (RuvC/YqgF family)